MVTCADCVLFMTVTGERRRQFVTLKICNHSEGPPPAKCCAHPPSATTTHLNTGVSCGVSQSVISRGGASTDWVWGLCGDSVIFSPLFSVSLYFPPSQLESWAGVSSLARLWVEHLFPGLSRLHFLWQLICS